MREIKFRCWQITCEDNDKGEPIREMIDADCLAFENYEPLKDLLTSHKDSEIFMEYTGLKDKNGKEIYEGDLLKLEGVNTLMEVKWWGDSAGFNLAYVKHNKCEVIGNIYEH